jgi:hypothetical protein
MVAVVAPGSKAGVSDLTYQFLYTYISMRAARCSHRLWEHGGVA